MDVNKIMTESFDMLLNRDKNLNQIVHDSANLRNDSKDVSGPMGSFCVWVVAEEVEELEDGVLVQEVHDPYHYMLSYIRAHRVEALPLLMLRFNIYNLDKLSAVTGFWGFGVLGFCWHCFPFLQV